MHFDNISQCVHIDLLCNPPPVYQTSGLEYYSTWQTFFSHPRSERQPNLNNVSVVCKKVPFSLDIRYAQIDQSRHSCRPHPISSLIYIYII